MTFVLTAALEHRLTGFAANSGETAEQVVEHGLERYLAHVEALGLAVRDGEESAARDGWLSNEDVFERLNRKISEAA